MGNCLNKPQLGVAFSQFLTFVMGSIPPKGDINDLIFCCLEVSRKLGPIQLATTLIAFLSENSSSWIVTTESWIGSLRNGYL